VIRRCTVVTLAVVVLDTACRHRPAGLPHIGSPDAAIAPACAWVAWGVVAYLCVAVAVAAWCDRPGDPSGPALHRFARVAPPVVRRVVHAVLSAGVAVTSAAAAAPALADSPSPGQHSAASRADRDPLDWPGLSGSATQRTAAAPAPGQRPASRSASPVTVAPGDTLWHIAQTRLGNGANAVTVAQSWPRWYAANRRVIGADPDLIHPGQRLRPPSSKDTR
jgi:LysM repeat protein